MKKIGFEGGRATIVPANVSGTYTYIRESANSGRLKIDIPGTVGEFYKTRDDVTLSFSSGSSVSVTGIMGARSYTNESIQYGKGKVSITQDSTDDDSSDDTNEDSKNFAPSSLSDQYLTIKQGNNTLFVYKLDASGKVTVKHRFDDKANITLSPAGSYTYTKNGANTATLVATHKYITAVDHEEKSYKTTTGVFRYTLTFSGNKVGVAEEKGVMFKTYTFSLNSVSSTSPENDDDSDSSSGDTSDSNQNNNNDTNSGDAVYGWAPESISSKVLELKKAIESVGRLGFDGSNVVLSPVGATCGYSYKRLGDGKARVSITSSSSAYAGTLELQFTSETEVRVKGSIGGKSVECLATLTPGSVSSDEFVCPEGGWAPESVEGKVMTFSAGNPMEFGEGGYGTYSGGGWHSLEYTYEKTGDNTAVISGWYSQFTGHNFSYTIKFTSPTDFIWSGWEKFDDRYSSIYGSQKTYYTNKEGTYKP